MTEASLYKEHLDSGFQFFFTLRLYVVNKNDKAHNGGTHNWTPHHKDSFKLKEVNW